MQKKPFGIGTEESIDMEQSRHCSRAVKKTLSIPEWMNEAAIKAGVNFSQVLQEALMAKLNIQ